MSELLFRERIFLKGEGNAFVEMRAFKVPYSKEFPDCVKYSLSFIVDGRCILRYDNEHCKGHHKHFQCREFIIKFESIDVLVKNFLKEVEILRKPKLKGV